ncbi:hypothetical protein [Sediminibacterium soli]|uniref:hypothetical protein n=1 Tax=Sediminibacterium soli TaxID=2698829 RepID=UPI001379E1C3|nr:hypothetical protein [Sediminibacterium soli]NCI46689.1 hypothetical protein [Sediminibacterium soli]
MKQIKSIAIFFAFLIIGSTISLAQTAKQTSKSKYGGIIQTTGNYTIEMVKEKNIIQFYVSESGKKEISDKDIAGSVLFEFLNKTKSTASLTKTGQNSLQVNTPKANVFTYCTVSLTVKGQNINAKFKNSDISQEDIEHGHQH